MNVKNLGFLTTMVKIISGKTKSLRKLKASIVILEETMLKYRMTFFNSINKRNNKSTINMHKS